MTLRKNVIALASAVAFPGYCALPLFCNQPQAAADPDCGPYACLFPGLEVCVDEGQCLHCDHNVYFCPDCESDTICCNDNDENAQWMCG